MSTGTTEPSLLLSRLPNDESLSSFLVDSEDAIENRLENYPPENNPGNNAVAKSLVPAKFCDP